MTKETKRQLKLEYMNKTKEDSVRCLSAMGASAGGHDPCSWEGVMTMLSYVMRRQSYDNAAAAIMAASAWVWAHKECDVRAKMAEMEALFEREAGTSAEEAKPAGDKPAAPAAK